ncbi:MAG: hypothetical protein IT369_13520 [Candidatus Latescibacteria bacterium]|nr:hypothetical protein [Candidatus Latescibacterota bacterium]
MEPVRYRIDARDHLTAVNKSWAAFAAANNGVGLDPAEVIGQPLWRYLVGEELRHLFELLLKRVRRTQQWVVLPFRCDGPGERRFMQLEVHAYPDQSVDFVSRLLHAEPRPPVAVLGPGGARTQERLRICSWCNRVNLSQGKWVEVEEALSHLGLFSDRDLPQLAYDLCPTCEVEFRAGLPPGEGD